MQVHTSTRFGEQCKELLSLSDGSDQDAFFKLARTLFRSRTTEELEDLATMCRGDYDVYVTQALVRFSKTSPHVATELLFRGSSQYLQSTGHIRDSTLRGEAEFERTGATPPAVTVAEACVEMLRDPEITHDGWIYAFLYHHNILPTHGTVEMTSKIVNGLCDTQGRVRDCMAKITKDTPAFIVIGVFDAAYYISSEAVRAAEAAKVAKAAKVATAAKAAEERVSLDADMVKAYKIACEKMVTDKYEYFDEDRFRVADFWDNAQLYSDDMVALTPPEFRTQESSDDEEGDHLDPDALPDDNQDEDEQYESKQYRADKTSGARKRAAEVDIVGLDYVPAAAKIMRTILDPVVEEGKMLPMHARQIVLTDLYTRGFKDEVIKSMLNL